MMSKLATLISFVLILGFSSCGNNTNPDKNNNDTTKTPSTNIVGNDKDVHGCKGSAGYQWSQLKNNCIRLFETGIRLEPTKDTVSQKLSAFIVFKSDNIDDSVELFLPDNNGAIFLLKDKTNGAGKWTNQLYQLTQWKGTYSLENTKNTLLYQGAAVK